MAVTTYSVAEQGEPSEHRSRPPAQPPTPCRFVRAGQPTSTGPRLTSQKSKGPITWEADGSAFIPTTFITPVPMSE